MKKFIRADRAVEDRSGYYSVPLPAKKKITLYEGQYCAKILFTLIVGMLAGYLIGL